MVGNMKKFIKEKYLNIVFIILAVIIFIINIKVDVQFNSILSLIFIVLSYIFEKGSIKNKKYHFTSKYKIAYNLFLALTSLITFIIALNINGWDALGYIAFSLLFSFVLGVCLVFNALTRLFFRIFFKQKFNINENKLFNIIQIIISLIGVFGPYLFLRIIDN